MKVGSTVRIRIEKTVFGGDGLGHLDGQVVFVPGVIPGEAAAVKIVQAKPDFLRGRVAELLEPSPHRIQPVCRYHGKCPGCVYGHVAIEGEVKLKNRQLREFLRTLPGVEVENVLLPPLAPGASERYRNKIVLHMAKAGGDPALGYIGSDNRSVTDIPECALAHPAINAKLAELRADPGFFHTLHDRMELTLRHSERDGVVYWRNRPHRDEPQLTEQVPGGEFQVPRGSFFQVNPAGMAALWELVAEFVRSHRVTEVVDAYCGSGFFACAALAAGVKRVSGVESDAAAVEAARANVVRFGGDPERIHCADAAEWLGEHLEELSPEAVVVVDPPRTGLTWQARKALVEHPVRRLIYISCNPATLLRDLGSLIGSGFQLRQARLLNMFPRSAHFEVFTVLERKS